MKLKYILLYVADIEKTVRFYEKAFKLKRRFIHESGQYAEIETGETRLGFVAHPLAKSHGFTYTETTLEGAPPGFELGFTCDNVATVYKYAVYAGATPVSEPIQKPWGQTVSYVRDLNGYLIEICSPMD